MLLPVAGWCRACPAGRNSPEVPLEVIGTDAVLDLWAGEADIAIRYAHAAPSRVVAEELFRDKFWPVCSPRLFARGKRLKGPQGLARISHTLFA